MTAGNLKHTTTRKSIAITKRVPAAQPWSQWLPTKIKYLYSEIKRRELFHLYIITKNEVKVRLFSFFELFGRARM